MLGERVLKLRVTLKGRPLRTYVFNKETITVGRNPESDIFLDNPGISRDHLRIVLTPRGTYAVEDLGSANGTLINDVIVKRQNLLENDVIRVGKYSLWVTYEQERRRDASSQVISPSASEGTTVLSTTELQEMISNIRRVEADQEETAETKKGDGTIRVRVLSRAATGLVVLTALVSMAIGIALGAGATLLWIR